MKKTPGQGRSGCHILTIKGRTGRLFAHMIALSRRMIKLFGSSKCLQKREMNNEDPDWMANRCSIED